MEIVIAIVIGCFLLKFAYQYYLKKQAFQVAESYKDRTIGNRRAALKAGEKILKYFHSINKESVAVLFLNSNNYCIKTEMRFGNNYSVEFSPSEIINIAESCKAKKIVIMHNHPDERPIPSDHDVSHAADLYDFLGDKIELVDHLVWCQNGIKSVLNTHRFKQMIRAY